MVCLSTAEAEYIAATEVAKDILWLRGLLLHELRMLPADPSPFMLLRSHLVSLSPSITPAVVTTSFIKAEPTLPVSHQHANHSDPTPLT